MTYPLSLPSLSARRLLAVGTMIFAIVTTSLPGQDATAEAVAKTRTVIEQFVATKSLLTKEAKDHADAKESLTARMEVVQREIDSLQKRITDAEASVAEADKKRAELLAESEQRKASVERLATQVAGFEQEVAKVLKRLPEPLRDNVKPLTQLLPQPGEEQKQSLGARWMNVIGILDAIQKWNREVKVTSESRALPDGTTVAVAAIYFGLGQGYYVTNNGKIAGIGGATADGWVWKSADELAPAVQLIIKIMKNEEPAAFVRLPVQIL
jgi:hypothetical protein